MPTLVFFLARMGMVTAGFLIKHTKYAVLIIFILGAVLSPGTDVVSQALMAGPMLVLYALSIGIAWLFAKRKPAGVVGSVGSRLWALGKTLATTSLEVLA